MKIDINKKYKYRNGEPARILCVYSPKEKYPVISLRSDGITISHTPDGIFIVGQEAEWDLIEDVPPMDIWVNFYDDGGGDHCVHLSEDSARRNKANAATRIAVHFREVKEND